MRVLPKQNFFSIWLKTAQRLRSLTMSFWFTFSSRSVNEVHWVCQGERSTARESKHDPWRSTGDWREVLGDRTHIAVWGSAEMKGRGPESSRQCWSTQRARVGLCLFPGVQQCSSSASQRTRTVRGDAACSKLEEVVFLQLTEHFWTWAPKRDPKGSGSASLVHKNDS